MRRIAQNIEYVIKCLQKQDIPTILQISDDRFGKDYITEDMFAFNDRRNFCLVAIDVNTKVPIGFCWCKIIPGKEAKKISKSVINTKDEVGYVKTIAVDKNYEGKGIASKLLEVGLNCLLIQNNEYVLIFSTAWKTDKINIGNILTKNGFTEKKELEDYWYDYSIKHKVTCPYCKTIPCRCSCVIFTKWLKMKHKDCLSAFMSEM